MFRGISCRSLFCRRPAICIVQFTYDHLGCQLTRTLPLGTIGGSGFVESFVYDDSPGAGGQMIRHTDFEGRVTEFAYDNTPGSGGRLTTKEFRTATGQPIDESVTYAYDAFGRQTSVTHDLDASGATTTDRLITSYTFDAEGRTKSVTTTLPGAGGVLSKTYTLGHDVIAQQSPSQASADTLTFLYDGHGSTRALLDALGAAAERYAYDAYGVMLQGTGLTAASAALTTILYAGEQFDHRTGLGYNRARYYDPVAGRFNRLDLWLGNPSEPLTFHKYLYAHANPINGRDPTGLGYIQLGVSVGLTALLYAVTYGSIRFAFAKARGLSTAAAFREGLIAGGYAAILAIPIIGPIYGIVSLADAAHDLYEGQVDDLGKLELATVLLASLVLGRVVPRVVPVATAKIAPTAEPAPVPFGQPGLRLSERLGIFFERLRTKPQPRNPKEALDTIVDTLTRVENAYSGIPAVEPPPLRQVGPVRMYPPRSDYTKYNRDGSATATTQGHRINITKNGRIQIWNRKTNALEFDSGPGQLPYGGSPDVD